MGAEMASVHSREQFAFLQKITLNSDEASYGFWLGGKRNKTTAALFQWTDGSEWNYHHWADLQPYKGLNYDFVYMNTFMHVTLSSSPLHQLCQKQAKTQRQITVELKLNETVSKVNNVSKLESRIAKIENIFKLISH
ncbi:hypothetical protein B4U80_14572 [Leptotrombidium deliense]|uniref:C-type lectin domain-containing protein n=1 Tax=Leptotrombidium deliense TaxID=299467 RepID=A0A443RTU8_9ACAR|nr:hypothetical protein B4U80_14572 [Leptotrombidium deliense]